MPSLPPSRRRVPLRPSQATKHNSPEYWRHRTRSLLCRLPLLRLLLLKRHQPQHRLLRRLELPPLLSRKLRLCYK
ncbi:hypothetical protein HYQ46_010512 [Verticillium longisporum]|nr:hypothetical protein HYQ46_010512 [Verticillium longisporum]